jgi:hypothetical protein
MKLFRVTNNVSAWSELHTRWDLRYIVNKNRSPIWLIDVVGCKGLKYEVCCKDDMCCE